LVLYNVTVSNNYSRLPADYSFHFHNFKNIPLFEEKGYIIVDFPSQFDIPDGPKDCDSPTREYASVDTKLSCYVTNNRAIV